MDYPVITVTSNSKDGCAIMSAFVMSCSLCIIGLMLILLHEDVTTGVVLLFVSGSILTLTVCAAVGRCNSAESKTFSSENIDDQPPSYRISWRRSFMRRVRHTNLGDTVGADTETSQQTSNIPSSGLTSLHLSPDHSSRPDDHSSLSLRTNETTLSISDRTLLTNVEDASRFPSVTRHTQSLTNILDPPSYEDVIKSMDEATKRRLKSEMCLPSIAQS